MNQQLQEQPAASRYARKAEALIFHSVLVGLLFSFAEVSNVAAEPSTSPLQVDVKVDLTRGLSIGESTRLRREAYFNIHGTPKEITDKEAEYLLGELRGHFGRSMGYISSFFAGQNEDPQRPGFAEPVHLRKLASKAGQQTKSINQTRHGTQQIVASAHPYSYYGKAENKKIKSDGFVPGSHEASAEILAALFSQLDSSAISYFEVANEGNVHTRELGTTMADLCRLHEVVAQRLHEEAPSLKVGGPCSAWPAFEFGDFKIWREQMGLFIDSVGKSMDFLSVHLYTTHWDNETYNRFGANVDAILDLMENQSLLSTGEVKPLLISECGTGFRKGEKIHDEYSEYRDWLVLSGANHILFDLLRRDNRLIKMIPFIVLKATWYQSEDPYPWVLFHKRNGEWKYTNLVKWYQFWKDVEGEFIPVSSSEIDVQAMATLSGRNLFLCLDNLGTDTAQFNVTKSLGGQLEFEQASITRLFLDQNAPRLVANAPLPKDLQKLEIRPDEAVIVRIELPSEPTFQSTLVETTHYGNRTLVPITKKPVRLAIDLPVSPNEITDATLRVSFGRKKSLPNLPTVRINGKKLAISENDRGIDNKRGNDYFAAKEIKVPSNLLESNNRISIAFEKPGGHVSTAVLTVRREVAPSARTAKARVEILN